jgi:hypothetical protein
MNKKQKYSRPSIPPYKSLVVVSRASSKLPLLVPTKQRKPDSEDLELERAKKACAGTTPQGREIIRKVMFMARRALYESPEATDELKSAPTRPPEQVNPGNSVQPSASAIAASPGPLLAAASLHPMANARQFQNSATPKITAVASSPKPPSPITTEESHASELPADTEQSAPVWCSNAVRGYPMEQARKLGLL